MQFLYSNNLKLHMKLSLNFASCSYNIGFLLANFRIQNVQNFIRIRCFHIRSSTLTY